MAGVDWSRGIQVNASAAVTQAAVDGLGVALGRSVVVADDIAAGRLVRLFPEIAHPLRWAYFVVHRPEVGRLAKVTAFRDWLMAEAAARRDPPLKPPP